MLRNEASTNNLRKLTVDASFLSMTTFTYFANLNSDENAVRVIGSEVKRLS